MKLDIESLMSGVAIVIDDAVNTDGQDDSSDKINEIVEFIESDWKIPCYKWRQIPSHEISENLLKSASIVLLDWKLWSDDIGEELRKDKIEINNEFLRQAKSHSKPVFIFTNENVDDVIYDLDERVYFANELRKNFIFIKSKQLLLEEEFKSINEWVESNAFVYVSKTWEQEFYKAKKTLFAAMYDHSPDWPIVFWKAYEEDKVNASASLTQLINDLVTSRVNSNIFKKKYFKSESEPVVKSKDLKSVIQESSFISNENLAPDEIKAGDLFKVENEYYINIRPDCDCVPRGNYKDLGSVELYCIVGKSLRNNDVKRAFNEKYGNLEDRPSSHTCFSIYENKTIKFDFKKFLIKEYKEIRDERIGRLVPPHITKLLLRYTHFLQRIATPRIPEEAIDKSKGKNTHST